VLYERSNIQALNILMSIVALPCMKF